MIGHKIYQVLKKHFNETWVSLRHSKENYEKFDFFDFRKILFNSDLSNFKNLSGQLNFLDPDIIINAAGITIRRGVEASKYNTILMNSTLPHLLNNWVSNNINKRLIHFSTDCVFSGIDGSYENSSQLDAKDFYGKTKGLGEVIGENTLTLRGSMIGRELENKTELLEWFLKNKGQEIKGYSNAIYSGITTLHMAHFVKDIIEFHPNLSGIYNVSSNPISKFDLLLLFNKHFNNESIILNDPSYVSKKNLNADEFYTRTGFEIPDWTDLIIELKRDSDLNNKYYN